MTAPKVLVVDDDHDSLTFVKALLTREGLEVATCDDGSKAVGKMESFTPDLILLDIHMPGLDGFDTIKLIKAEKPNLGVIFLTGEKNTEILIRGLESGARDYICKPFVPMELVARVRTQLRVKKLQDELMEANRKLQSLVDVDDLTGLLNMRTIYQRLDNEMDRSRRYGHGLGIIMLDMDNFKKVNDNHDHLFGSQVLALTGEIIRKNIRSVDFAARYGGDEFLICLTHTVKQGAEAFAERLRKIIAETEFVFGDDKIRLTASMGMALIVDGHTDMDGRSLVRHADKALYKSKDNGRNRVTVTVIDEPKDQKHALMRK